MSGFLPAFLTRSVRPPEPLPDSLDVAGQAVPLAFREHATAKRLILRVTPAGEVVVTVPRHTPRKAVLAFVDRHRGWVDRRLAGRAQTPRVADGSLLPFRGGELRLRHAPGLRASRLDGGDDGIATVWVGGDHAHLARRVRDFMVREARRDLQAAVDRHSASVGLRASALTIKDTTSRWGSCTVDRRLAFSFRIVMAPPSVLDYLAAHEVAHFVHMNHAPEFWALCRRLCPATDAGRGWLKARGSGLQAIRF